MTYDLAQFKGSYKDATLFVMLKDEKAIAKCIWLRNQKLEVNIKAKRHVRKWVEEEIWKINEEIKKF
jgi:hypothetical protein